MRFFYTFTLLMFSTYIQAQTTLESLYDASLEPFYHGVASGDPLHDRVIIWTRVSPKNSQKPIKVSWKMTEDVNMNQIVQSGTVKTDASRDFTVKIDVDKLFAGKTYYYQFEAFGKKSIIGRTKTTPKENVEHLRFAVVSCSNYQAGYFNAYGRIAEHNDLDAVVHLGDYIYEYEDGKYGDSTLIASGKRTLFPKNEIIKLEDYRQRYALYRLDPDLRRVHQQHPFITVWDDHESANNSYTSGAENHNQGEGEWQNRKQIARQVYAEWLPIRGNAQHIYRKINYGNLMDLYMLDTRLEGRDEQIMDIKNPDLQKEDRTILGKKQREWLFSELKKSQATWKVLGNQVMFAEFNVGWAAQGLPNWAPEKLESVFLDIWDGYPAGRQKILKFLEKENINNVIILTGDVHSSYAYDIPLSLKSYDNKTGKGSLAIEFVAPGITSANYDELIGMTKAKMLEYQMNKPLPGNFGYPNPHMKYVDLTQHGYFILDLTPEKAQADWFYADDILNKTDKEHLNGSFFTKEGENHLQKAEKPSSEKKSKDIATPKK